MDETNVVSGTETNVVNGTETSVPEEPKITTEEKPKEKDPKRVAAGKRLAAISKAAKEEKMRRLLEQEKSWFSSSLSSVLVLSMGIGILGFASYKYFFAKKPDEVVVHNKVEIEEPEKKTVSTSEEPKTEKKKRGKPISMFD